jgi:hypothetical protein
MISGLIDNPMLPSLVIELDMRLVPLDEINLHSERQRDILGHSGLDKPVKPMHCLMESLLLRPFLPFFFQAAANSEAMHDVRKEIDLPRDIHAEQDIFGLVSLLCRENMIGFY